MISKIVPYRDKCQQTLVSILKFIYAKNSTPLCKHYDARQCDMMQDNAISSRKTLFIYLILGAFLGGMADILWYFDVRNVPLCSFLLIFCLTFGLSYNEKNSLRLIISSIVVGFLLSTPLFIFPNSIKDFPDYNGQLVSYLSAFPLLLYIGHTFHYAYHQDNTWKVTYPSLFAAVWDSFIMLVAGSIFAQISTLLIYFAAVLFSSLGFNFLKIILSNVYVNIPLHTILFFLGICIAQQNHKLLHNLRFLLLRMMQFLFPLLATISIIYFILYIVTFLNPAGEERFMQNILLGCMVVLGIIFFNASFQTGENSKAFPRWFSLLLKLYFIALLGMDIQFIHFCLVSNELPLNVGMFLLLSLLYCLSYLTGIYQRNDKVYRWIISANISIALFFLLAMLIINNPIHPINYRIGSDLQPKKSFLAPIPIKL